jgi:hypothetical protein
MGLGRTLLIFQFCFDMHAGESISCAHLMEPPSLDCGAGTRLVSPELLRLPNKKTLEEDTKY